MPQRVIANVDLGATLTRALGRLLEQDIVLDRGGRQFTASGFWSRVEGNEAEVTLIPNTGTIGDLRPVPGDRIKHLGETMRIIEGGVVGVDGVFWRLTTTPAVDEETLPTAPPIALRRTSPGHLMATTTAQLRTGAIIRSEIRQAGTGDWEQRMRRPSRTRLFNVGIGAWEVGMVLIDPDGVASAQGIEAITELAA